jgi:hypothetical protein
MTLSANLKGVSLPGNLSQELKLNNLSIWFVV